VLNVVELFGTVRGLLNAVFVLPLKESDPDYDGCEFVGVELCLDAVELAWRDHFCDYERDALLGGELACLKPQSSRRRRRRREVSGAAGGVEHADGVSSSIIGRAAFQIADRHEAACLPFSASFSACSIARASRTRCLAASIVAGGGGRPPAQ